MNDMEDMKKLGPIKKDYCTLSPEGNWAVCCQRHDRRYVNKRLTRLQADKLLYRCISRKSNIFYGFAFFISVRLVGWVFYNKLNRFNLQTYLKNLAK